MRRLRHQSWLISGVYCMIGTLWIIFSDLLFVSLFDTSQPWIHIAKGVGFIVVTSMVLFVMLRSYEKQRVLLERYLDKLFYSFPQSLWLYDYRKERIHNANDEFLKMFAFHSKQEVAGRSLTEIMSQNESDNLHDFITGHNQNSFHAGIREFRKHSGEPLFLETWGFWMPYRRSSIVMLVGINMSEYVNTLSVVADQEHRISSGSDILKDIAWTYSHELRKPLANIIGLVAMAEHTTTEEELKRIVSDISNLASELDDTVRVIVNKTYFRE